MKSIINLQLFKSKVPHHHINISCSLLAKPFQQFYKQAVTNNLQIVKTFDTNGGSKLDPK